MRKSKKLQFYAAYLNVHFSNDIPGARPILGNVGKTGRYCHNGYHRVS